MMGSNGQTIITYAGGTPTISGTVTLFDSTVAFPSTQTPAGGSFHLLGLQWLQFVLAIGSVLGGGTGAIVGEFSDDKGTTWTVFYNATTADGTAPAFAVNDEEVYVGMFKDIRFRYTNALEVPTIFRVAIALNPHKSTSKAAATDLLLNNATIALSA
jgi:hypothetical protein